jgi:hypothetical protein
MQQMVNKKPTRTCASSPILANSGGQLGNVNGMKPATAIRDPDAAQRALSSATAGLLPDLAKVFGASGTDPDELMKRIRKALAGPGFHRSVRSEHIIGYNDCGDLNRPTEKFCTRRGRGM